MQIKTKKNVALFKVNYENDMETYYLDDVYFSDKTELIDTFAEWYRIKPHLNSDKIKKSLHRAFDDYELNEKAYEDIENGEFSPCWINHPYCEDLLEFDADRVEKHDKETYDHFIHLLENDMLDIDDYCEWLLPKSWFAYQVAHRCYHVSYYEKEFGEILYPELDWYIVHTSEHAMAMGLSDDGHVDKIFDMNWAFEDGYNSPLPNYLIDASLVDEGVIERVPLKPKVLKSIDGMPSHYYEDLQKEKKWYDRIS